MQCFVARVRVMGMSPKGMGEAGGGEGWRWGGGGTTGKAGRMRQRQHGARQEGA